MVDIVSPDGLPKSPNPAEWKYTQKVRERPMFFEEKGKPEPGTEELYQGRPIIGRDTQVNGGVYLVVGSQGNTIGEAIVVDDTKDSYLNEAYKKFLDKAQARRKRVGKLPWSKKEPFNAVVLNQALDSAIEELPYDLKKVDEINKEHLIADGRKVNLSVYMGRAGVCRHQALLSTYLLQRLGKEGYVRGSASVDRNYVPGQGGHAWTRYTNSAGEVFIIDPANKYAGSLDDASSQWFYKRPTD